MSSWILKTCLEKLAEVGIQVEEEDKSKAKKRSKMNISKARNAA
jgi:hypothetical protein